MRVVFGWLVALWVALAQAAVPDFSAVVADDEFLPVEQAFRPETLTLADNHLRLRWTIAPGYALYRERIQVTAANAPEGVVLAAPTFLTASVIKNDPNFGQVAVFHDEAVADLRVSAVPAAADGQLLTLTVRYQGCADDGLCYPPQQLTLRMPLATLAAASAAEAPPAPPGAPATDSTSAPATDDAGGIAGFLHTASLPLVVLTFLVLGIGLTFTPCVFPMMPILSGLIAGEDRTTLTTARAFRLSLAYVLGMALTYAAAGVLVGYFGARANLQLWLQTPPVLVGFALVFVLLALSMFGVYELQLPAFLRDRLDALSRRQQGGRLAGVAVMGALSALVVSPCVSAPLAGALIYISSTGDALLGGLALLALGLGMGLPLLLLGTSSGRLLPRAGNWMLVVKAVFGVGLLAVAVWLLARVVPGPVALLLWALLAAGVAVQLGALEPAAPGWPRAWKALGVLLLLQAVLLLVGAAAGQSDPLAPLAGLRPPALAATAQAQVNDEVHCVRVDSEAALRR
ncbi:MAG: protein-disulfide reductase DsbD, partial [Moraxellaceae bacterium]